MTGAKDHVLSRYYVDLSRGGHVIRCTSYSFGGELQGQADVKLSSFRVDGKEVWMPVSVEHFGSMALNRKTMTPYLTRKPTSREKIVVVGGTMAFNTNPSRDTFTLDYTPGTPISDQRRKMTTEFGKQKISPNPTKVEADAMLKEQLAKAEAQKRELVASPSEGIDWVKWLPLAGILAVGASSIGLWRQRRRSH
jgi:hypothetical protein